MCVNVRRKTGSHANLASRTLESSPSLSEAARAALVGPEGGVTKFLKARSPAVRQTFGAIVLD